MNAVPVPRDAAPTDGLAGPGTPVVTDLDVEHLTVPLSRPWGPDVTRVHVLTTRVHASDGSTGTGFSWTPTIGAGAVLALLREDVREFAIGRPAATTWWTQAWEHLHEAGGGGVTTIALAGLDLALWDLRARAAGTSVTDLVGRRRDSQPTYGSGVNLHYPDAELLDQVRRWIGAGHTGVKIKVGRPDLREDLRRVAAVRELLGPDRALMVDANQRWDLDRATTALGALAEFDLTWVEEPLRADDTLGLVELRRRTAARIAVGENVHTWYRFRDLVAAGAADVLQPNVVRVGGITPFLRIADLVRSAGLELAPHLLPELSGQLALTLPERTWVEDVEDAGFAELGILAAPTGGRCADGEFRGGTRAGLGFEFGVAR
ncbi:mandelate racemase/muconate lactonizing enzyme family protein [Kineococcus rhizosphaerae]|uniref:L-alanine-DL-glutamate epimerase-like enolase superfamily enzyme n=1 Tax=Kineococcus rhizosphaerae TaxID=559628 RepID=A0A2T0QXJ5_9ACTN|nr:mandelate racemase/muconate lactonizing enzyme family protein [Kineococcus rhizosphaerae]PRY10537.1 L-alanine-DL-glutamate epimerase-like enolase superfamily enzyme [Kineococcus rhizosphaerae]